jgi:hypothetical protein
MPDSKEVPSLGIEEAGEQTAPQERVSAGSAAIAEEETGANFLRTRVLNGPFG